MFDKINQAKNLLKMRSEAQKIQKELKGMVETYESGDVRVKVNGAGGVEYIEKNGEPQEDIKDAVNEATKRAQKKAAQKMMEMGGGLSGLLGGTK